MKNALFFCCCFVLLLHACSYEFPEEPQIESPDLGSADLANFVVIGSTWSAGYMDGALYTEGQKNAYPAVFMEHLNQLSETTLPFIQPWIKSEMGYDGYSDSTNPQGRKVLEYLKEGKPYLFKKSLTGENPQNFNSNTLNNFSVPQAKLIELANPDLQTNSFYTRFSQSDENTSLVEEVIHSNPTLILFHPGMEDLLNFAAKGLTTQVDPTPEAIGKDDLTPIGVYETHLRQVLKKLTEETTAPIILVNLPDFTRFPFFTHLGHLAPINMEEARTVDQFYNAHNDLVFQYNSIVSDNFRPLINFFADDSPTTWTLTVADPLLPNGQLPDGTIVPKLRQMLEGELLLWSIDEFPNAEGLGLKIPVDKSFYLTQEEIAFLSDLIPNYNNIIEQVSNTYPGVTLLDLNAYLQSIPSSGIFIDGVLFTPDFGRTGIFSADGLNLNQRGQALLANLLIQHLEEQFSAKITPVNINHFKGNEFRLAF